MQAIVYARYGPPDVLELQETAIPIPADGEVLIRVRAASVNPYDWHFMRGEPYLVRLFAGLTKPKDRRLGADVAGQVQAVGQGVTGLKPGDAVFGMVRGAFAEFACAPQTAFALKPGNVSFEQAAAAPIAGLTALQGLRDKGKIKPGQRVLINGAAGGVGTFSVQIAKAFGAEVTGVCSTRNLAMVRAIGADHVIDYTQADFTLGTERYDILLDAIGNHPVPALLRCLNPGGICVPAGGDAGKWMIGTIGRSLQAMVLSWLGSRKVAGFIAKSTQADLATLADFLRDGKVTPMIDRCYPLRETPEAIRYLEEGHARGKVIVSCG